MLTTPTHHNRRLRAGAVLATFGLGLPVGMAPALAETLAAQAEVKVAASATTDAGTADNDDEAGLAGAVKVQANVAVHGYLNGLLDGSGADQDWSGIADTLILTDAMAAAAAAGALALDVAGGGVGGGAGGDVLPAVPGLSLDGGLPLIGGIGSEDGEPGSSELPTEVLGLLLSDDGDAGLPGVGLPNLGLPGAGLPGVGLPGLGLPGLGLPSTGLPGLDLPGVGLPGLGLPGIGLPGLGLPGLGLPTLPVRLPSLVLPSVVNPTPSGQEDDPAVVNAGHVGPVGGLVNETEGKTGDGPSPRSVGVPAQPNGGPSQFGGGSPGSLPRTGANLRLRALAAFGLLGLAGLGSRRRRDA